jgi:hypothetical protein
MIGLLCFVLAVLASPFKSKVRFEAENAVLRHQLIVVRRRLPGRVRLTNHDRWFFIQLYRWFPSILQVLTIIRPETLVRWHRAGFRCYWRWKSLPLGGRPQIDTELRVLIRRMRMENPLWGAPRIHGELLKLGFEVAQSSVAKYMVKRRGPPISSCAILGGLHHHYARHRSGQEAERCRMAQATAPILDSTNSDIGCALRQWSCCRFSPYQCTHLNRYDAVF